MKGFEKRYSCRHSDCKIIYEAVIQDWSINKLCCKINWEGNCKHERLPVPVSHCRGKERRLLAIQATSLGVGNVVLSNKFKEMNNASGAI